MDELFGVSMTLIAGICLVVTIGILLLVAYIAWRNPVMFKLGLRNLPRRKAQTALIIVGLMLSTLIISAAFGTGDTLTSSVTSEVYKTLGEADQWIAWDAEEHPRPLEEQVIPLETVEGWQRTFAGDAEIEAIVPFQRETLPIQNTRTRLNEPSARIVGFRAEDAAQLGGLKDVNGDPVQLAGRDIAINDDLAEEIDANVGDKVVLLNQGEEIEFVVKAIVPVSVLSGGLEPSVSEGGTIDFATMAELTGRGQNADAVIVSNAGGPKDGLKLSDSVTERFEAELEGSPYQVIELKEDFIQFAKLIGSTFTAVFVVFGLFSIAAGVLLIFLIFVMLAAERKPEMGMTRAVGAKRRQLVESFLAEGMGYDLGAAVVGLFAGMAVTFAMVGVLKAFAGENLGLTITVSFTAQSIITAFCLGVMATFLVIFISSWRASRLNITAAIRDLPESHPINPEASTWRGYYRAVLNGIVALALPIGFAFFLFGTPGMILGVPMVLIGLVSPWFYMLRGSNVAAPRELRLAEGPPKWPWILGLAIPVLGWALIFVPFWIAVGLIRLTRDRKPETLPAWLGVTSLVIWPVAFVAALLQTWRVSITWSAGAASALGIAGIALTFGGMDRDSAFYFLLGFSLLALWAAVTLRYFGVSDRLAFSAVSLVVLAVWYMPASWLDPLVGELNGDIEMFFLSGMVMVSCGTFLVIYNADIFLPAIAKVASRWGRIVPALKTGVAYPLTSRFRTGMTMAMIGLIMFSLVMMATINSNFAALFLNEDTKGGYDVVLDVNRNNPVDDLERSLTEAGVDTSPIVSSAQIRIAGAQEAEVSNKDEIEYENDDTGEDEVPAFRRYPILGGDQAFFATNKVPMKFRAAGYADDRAVWDALAADPLLAVIPAGITVQSGGFGPPATDLLRLLPIEDDFEPFPLTLRDPGTGKEATVTVIAQIKEAGDTFFGLTSAGGQPGIVTSATTLLDVFPQAEGQRFYVDLAPEVDAEDYAKQVESGLVAASANSLQALLDEQQELQNGFLLVFQGFMGLGLIVGIAALAVIASRAVVERRQQIGMLRAIGYQRSMVALAFLFESGFIALSGILLGLTLGLSLAWVLFVNGEFGEESRNIDFVVPWANLAIICGIAFLASMFMTFLPARAASRVPVAEALRYE